MSDALRPTLPQFIQVVTPLTVHEASMKAHPVHSAVLGTSTLPMTWPPYCWVLPPILAPQQKRRQPVEQPAYGSRRMATAGLSLTVGEQVRPGMTSQSPQDSPSARQKRAVLPIPHPCALQLS